MRRIEKKTWPTFFLKVFRGVMVLIGVIIIYFSIHQQLIDNYYYSKGVVTQGKVTSVWMCAPNVMFKDRQDSHIAHTSPACDAINLTLKPQIGDIADVIYYPKNPAYAKVLRVYSSKGTYVYSENTWRFESISFSIFGLVFIVLAFVPKKLR